ncbi:uncharacterized protein LOC141834459 [Curcuma longa]|uniref:uncharacterized protein LOC141834459 n=1 Tax=Curcuma longa TaxID=136217 RepID=UPI003D9F18B0
MARKKVTLGWIAHDATRRATFKKRKQSLLKKVSELATLCGIDACAVVYGPEEEAPEVWPSPAETARVAARFRAVPELDQTRKKTDQEGFLRQRTAKLWEQLSRQEGDNRELEASLLMHEVLSGSGRRMCDVGIEQAAELVRLAEMKLVLVRNRIEREKARIAMEPPWQAVEQVVGMAENPWTEFLEPPLQADEQVVGIEEDPWKEFVEPLGQVVGMAEDPWIEFVEPLQQVAGMGEDPWTESLRQVVEQVVGKAEDPRIESPRQVVEQMVGTAEDPRIESPRQVVEQMVSTAEDPRIESPRQVVEQMVSTAEDPRIESPRQVVEQMVGMAEDPWKESPPLQAVEQVVGTAEDPWIEFVKPPRQAVEQEVGMAEDPWTAFVELTFGIVPASCFESESLDYPPWQAPWSLFDDFD